MAKVAIITLFENNYNYGAVLQAYALRKMIVDSGYSCDVVRYKQSVPPRSTNNMYEIIQKKLFKENLYTLIQKTYKLLIYKKKFKIFIKNLNKRKHLFHLFYEKNLTLSPLFDSSSIVDANKIYDIFVCGSDQIWNPGWYDKTFFLDFAEWNKGKIAYAPSIAVSALDKEQKDFMKPLIENLDFLSVREQNGVEMISEITNIEVKLVLDPTLLLEKSDWEDLMDTRSLIQGSYIFCYVLGNDKKQMDDIKKWAKRKNVKVVMIPSLVPDSINIPSTFETIYDIGPKEFLNLVKNADGILTDSFHGTIFSMIFEKKFFVIKRGAKKGQKSMHSRLESLLDLANCSDLIVDSSQLLEEIDFKFKEIYKLNIERLRNDSRDFLINSLLTCDSLKFRMNKES